ncbi:MAG TPA: pitrilysin family protein, partial [Gemmatimonadaceae bacterium]|nr:pitrilysin family protein [Gemmatimonadaceae bacterium]
MTVRSQIPGDRRCLRRRAPLLLAAALAAAPVVAAAQFPTTPPPAAPISPAQLPPTHEATLTNGVHLLVVESHKLPVLSINMAFRAGDFTDPTGKEGLASLTATLLTKGAGARTAEQISQTIEGVGGSIGAGTDDDVFSVSANGMSTDKELIFSLLGDVVARPAFDQKEVDLAKTQLLSALRLQNSNPGAIAARTFNRALHGSLPYGRAASPASVQAITRDDIVAFHRGRVKPRGALLVVAGDIDLATATRLATAAFKGWTGAPAAVPALGTPKAPTKTKIILVDRPSSVQANILVGYPSFTATDPRRYPLTVANRVLGGGAHARLFTILREQKSWTYGSYSAIANVRGVGDLTANVEARNEVADSALVELLAQLSRLRTEPVPAQEFADAKNAITGSYPLGLETARQLALALANARLLGLPANYVATYRNRIAAVTPASVQAVVKQVVRPDAALVVVVGDAGVLRDRLAKIAPVTVVDPEGNPVAPVAAAGNSPAPSKAPVAIDASKLVAASDSSSILVQGNPFGSAVKQVQRSADAISIIERAAIGPMMSQTTTITLTPTGEMRSVVQTGSVQGIPTKIEANYANGRVKGNATTVSQAGPKSVAFDTTIAPGTVDENAVSAIVPALPWSKTASFTLPVFASGEGVARTFKLKV